MFRSHEDVQTVRKVIVESLGQKEIVELHRSNIFFDMTAFVLLWLVFFSVMLALARLHLGVLWFALLLFQGFLMQMIGLLSHDAFIHRKILGPSWSYVAAAVCFFPVLIPPLAYELSHLAHHRLVGTSDDTEAYKQDLDSFFKRLAFLTAPGLLMARSRKFAREEAVFPAEPTQSAETASRLKREKRWFLGFFLLMIAISFLRPSLFVYGYWLPLFISVPIAGTIRTILEHSDADPSHPFYLGTFYRTGWISGPLFMWDSGDCHLIHHYYAAIPFYRIPRALRLIRPILQTNGLPERRSLLRLLKGWFLDVNPHRTPWPRP